MRLLIRLWCFFVISFASGLASAEVEKSKFFIGTSAFILSGLDQNSSEPPKFLQLNLGYRLTKKDVISIEAITWRYYAPLGLLFDAKDSDKFPGYVSAKGAGLAYQRFLWNKFYAAIHATYLFQDYVSSTGDKLGSGHQLFVAYRIGYHFAIGKSFFLEPSIALTHWPVNTGLPPSFQEKEDHARKYQAEPGLHLGYVF